MPWRSEWVEPELFLRHNNVNVYHIYKDDDLDQYTRQYWFTVDPDNGSDQDDDHLTFDVTSLKTYEGDPKDALESAIDQGLLTQKGLKRI